MIYGIGTDLCDLRRLQRSLQRFGDRFAQKVLGPAELEVFRARRERAASRGLAYLGTRFAAKEAFAKAIGLGMRMPMTWRACETLNAPGGRPQIRLHGALAEFARERGLHAHVSVSDEQDYATAYVVVEQEKT